MCWHAAVFSGSFWDVCDKNTLLGGAAGSKQLKIKLDLVAWDCDSVD